MNTEATGLPHRTAPPAAKLTLALVAAAIAVALLGAGVLLWVRHGATVFYDMLATGLGTCL